MYSSCFGALVRAGRPRRQIGTFFHRPDWWRILVRWMWKRDIEYLPLLVPRRLCRKLDVTPECSLACEMVGNFWGLYSNFVSEPSILCYFWSSRCDVKRRVSLSRPPFYLCALHMMRFSGNPSENKNVSLGP